MKKIFLSTIVLLLSVSLFAGFTVKFGPFDPYYPTSLVDPFSSLTGLHYLIETKSEEKNDIYLYNNDTMEFQRYEYRDWHEDSTNNVHMTLGANFAMLRMGWEDIFQVNFLGQAGLNAMFSAWGGTDMLGVDGMYFIGGESKIMDMFVIKAGIKHYSGHWGDEIIMRAEKKMKANGDGPANFSYDEYVRDNQWKVGIAFTGIENFNLSFSAAGPLSNTNFRPFLIIPDYIKHKSSGDLYIDRQPDEFAKRGPLENYHALILQLEGQYELPITDSIGLLLGANLKLHEDGRMNYTMDPSDDDPSRWDVEYSLVAAVNFKNAIQNFDLSVDVIWHEGRFPLLNYYYKHSQYISVGFSVR